MAMKLRKLEFQRQREERKKERGVQFLSCSDQSTDVVGSEIPTSGVTEAKSRKAQRFDRFEFQSDPDQKQDITRIPSSESNASNPPD